MKRIVLLLLCLVLAFGLFSCGEEEEPARTYELAMIAVSEDQSIDDESYVQSAWEGLREYAEESGLTYKYYEPEEDSDSARLKQIAEAADSGAAVIVCAGGAFERVVGEAQKEYSDITFILAGAEPKDEKGEAEVNSNCVSVCLNETDAGFLAGYAAVQDGCRQLGFIGANGTDSARRYGYGFVQGCNAAAEELGVYADVRYSFTEKEISAAKLQKKAEQWYEEGTEVIFACGDGSFDSVAVEADIADAWVIAPDSALKDRSAKNVLTSVTSSYKSGVKQQLTAFYSGEFSGGTVLRLGAAEGAVGLSFEGDCFSLFREEDYDAVYDKLKKGQIKLASIEDAKTVRKLAEKMELRRVQII